MGKFKKTQAEKKLDKLETLAKSLSLRDIGDEQNVAILKTMLKTVNVIADKPFADPDPYNDLSYSSVLKAKLAIADYLGKPLALLSQTDRDFIEAILDETLEKSVVMARLKSYFHPKGDSTHAT